MKRTMESRSKTCLLLWKYSTIGQKQNEIEVHITNNNIKPQWNDAGANKVFFIFVLFVIFNFNVWSKQITFAMDKW